MGWLWRSPSRTGFFHLCSSSFRLRTLSGNHSSSLFQFSTVSSFLIASTRIGIRQASAEQQIIGTCSLSTNSTSSSSSSSQVCPISDSSGQQQVFALRTYKYVFVLAQLIMGVGGAPLYTLGVTFIDDNVSRKMQPVYSGIFYSGTMLGPALGYVLGGQFLRLYVDFDSISAEE